MKREPCKTAFEHDAISRWGRRWLCYTQRAGVCKAAKRQINRRWRRKWQWRDEAVRAENSPQKGVDGARGIG
jgi:hypothetical protein